MNWPLTELRKPPIRYRCRRDVKNMRHTLQLLQFWQGHPARAKVVGAEAKVNRNRTDGVENDDDGMKLVDRMLDEMKINRCIFGE